MRCSLSVLLVISLIKASFAIRCYHYCVIRSPSCGQNCPVALTDDCLSEDLSQSQTYLPPPDFNCTLASLNATTNLNRSQNVSSNATIEDEDDPVVIPVVYSPFCKKATATIGQVEVVVFTYGYYKSSVSIENSFWEWHAVGNQSIQFMFELCAEDKCNNNGVNSAKMSLIPTMLVCIIRALLG